MLIVEIEIFVTKTAIDFFDIRKIFWFSDLGQFQPNRAYKPQLYFSWPYFPRLGHLC